MGFYNKHFVNSDPKEVIQDSFAGILARDRSAGLVYYALDLQNYYGDSGAELINLSSVDLEDVSTYAILDCERADTRVDKWVVTNLTNATLTENAGTPLNRNRSYSFNNAVGAEGEYCYFEIALPRKVTLTGASLRGADLSYEYDGTANSLEVVLFDGSGNVIGTTTLENLDGNLLVLGSDNTQVVRFGVRVITGEEASLTFDDVRISNDPVTMINVKNDSDFYEVYNYNAVTYSGAIGETLRIQVPSGTYTNRSGMLEIRDNVGDTDFIAVKDGSFNVHSCILGVTGDWGTVELFDVDGTSLRAFKGQATKAGVTLTDLTVAFDMKAGQYFKIGVSDFSNQLKNQLTITATPLGTSKGYVTADEIKSETITYYGYSNLVSDSVNLSTELVNTSDKTLSLDISGGFQKYVFKKEASFVATASMLTDSSERSLRLRWFDKSDVAKPYPQQYNTYNASVSIASAAEEGDYLYMWANPSSPTDSLETHFSVTATPTKLATTVVAPVAVRYEHEINYSSNGSDIAVTMDGTFYDFNDTYLTTLRDAGLLTLTHTASGMEIKAEKDLSLNISGNAYNSTATYLMVFYWVGGVKRHRNLTYGNSTPMSGNFFMYEGQVLKLEQSTDGGSVDSMSFTIGATAVETGFIASAKSEVYKHANDKTPIEKVIGTWNSGDGRQPLYEKSYVIGEVSSGVVLDSTLTTSAITPRNNWVHDANQTNWYTGILTYSTSDYSYLQVGNSGLSYYWSNYLGGSNFSVQYTKFDIVNYLASDINTPTTNVASLGITSLEIGTKYIVDIIHRSTHAGAGGTNLTAQHNGSEILSVVGLGSGGDLQTHRGRVTFVALATSVTFDVTGADGDDIVQGNGTNTETYITLAKLV